MNRIDDRASDRALVGAVREWAIENRAEYLASDTEIGNETPRLAHEAIGLKEVERAVHFLQPLPVPQKGDLLPIASVELRALDQKSATDMMQLQTTPAQRRFVAANVNSLARAFLSDTAWVRGIYAGDVPVGVVMVNLKDTAYLWRSPAS